MSGYKKEKGKNNMGKFRYYVAIFIFLILNFEFLVLSLSGASWPMFRTNNHREGTIYEVAYPASSPVGWSIELQGEIIGSPVVKDDIVYFGARDTSIWALNAFTGEPVWQYSTSGYIDSTPCIWNGYLYVLSRDGKVYCFEQPVDMNKDYSPVWTFDTESNLCSSPIIVDGKLVFVSGPKLNGLPEGYLYVIDAINGTLITKHKLSMFSYSSPAYEDKKICFCTNDGTLYCYDILENKFLWIKKLLSSLNYTTVSLKNGIVYCYSGDIDRKLYAINSSDGKILWETEQLSNIATDNTSVSFYNDKIIVNLFPTKVWKINENVYCSSQSIVCVNNSNGTILWRKDFFVGMSPRNSYGIVSSPAVANNVVYLGTYNGDMYALDINNGEIITKYEFGSPIVCSPAVSNGWIYFGTVNGKFYGVKTEKFLSITQPDNYQIVINKTYIVSISTGFENEEYELEYSDTGEEWTDIFSGKLISGTTTIFWPTIELPDGEWKLRKVLTNKPTYFAMTSIIIDNSPLPPENLIGQIQNGNVLLFWEKSKDDGSGNKDVVSYKVYRATFTDGESLLSILPAGNTFYWDITCIPENTYYYKISAVDKNSESTFSNTVSIYFAGPSFHFPEKKEHEVKISPEGRKISEEIGGRKIELEFPPGSIEVEITLKIKFLTEQEFDNSVNSLLPGTKGTNVVYEFVVDKEIKKFKKPVTIKISYKDSDIKNMNENKLRLYWYDSKSKLWRMINESKPYPDNNYVEAKLWQFSIFRIVEYSPETDYIFKEEYVYTYPSPARQDKVYFKFLLYQPAKIKVYVYNILGELIWESDEHSYDETHIGRALNIMWNIKNIASGMYVYRVEGKNNKTTQNVIKKMAVIR